MNARPRRLRRLGILLVEIVLAVMVVAAYIAVLTHGFKVF
jgi:hypothetical protein